MFSDDFGCFHQLHCESSSRSPLLLGVAALRRHQLPIETLERNQLLSNVFYPQIELLGVTGNQPPGSQPREHELKKSELQRLITKTRMFQKDVFGRNKSRERFVFCRFYDKFFVSPQDVSKLIKN